VFPAVNVTVVAAPAAPQVVPEGVPAIVFSVKVAEEQTPVLPSAKSTSPKAMPDIPVKPEKVKVRVPPEPTPPGITNFSSWLAAVLAACLSKVSVAVVIDAARTVKGFNIPEVITTRAMIVIELKILFIIFFFL
jgi:hypothetical protein